MITLSIRKHNSNMDIITSISAASLSALSRKLHKWANKNLNTTDALTYWYNICDDKDFIGSIQGFALKSGYYKLSSIKNSFQILPYFMG